MHTKQNRWFVCKSINSTMTINKIDRNIEARLEYPGKCKGLIQITSNFADPFKKAQAHNTKDNSFLKN